MSCSSTEVKDDDGLAAELVLWAEWVRRTSLEDVRGACFARWSSGWWRTQDPGQHDRAQAFAQECPALEDLAAARTCVLDLASADDAAALHLADCCYACLRVKPGHCAGSADCPGVPTAAQRAALLAKARSACSRAPSAHVRGALASSTSLAQKRAKRRERYRQLHPARAAGPAMDGSERAARSRKRVDRRIGKKEQRRLNKERKASARAQARASYVPPDAL